MRINQKILNIPPYLSTAWINVIALKTLPTATGSTLFVTLKDGSTTEIPNLPESTLETIFSEHAKFHDDHQASSNVIIEGNLMTGGGREIARMLLPGFESFTSILQHNQEQYNDPDLPEEILNKLSLISKKMNLPDNDAFPKPEPHCNCPHCQITRAIQKGVEEKKSEVEDELISDEDLTFRSWDIQQKSQYLYEVTNPLDSQECYQVFLAEPIGCTCGTKHCEHIKAVLSS